ncbi:MAG TPA: hypothetical protein IAB72_01025 [Candidatus Onthoplasma faecipullorum]|nr:hypothetical protein [Candidatus Onthoplasma faecipullorum]
MTALEELKQELINQKNAIEDKGGTVIVANTYPSPAEITAGIKTIPTTSTSSSGPSVTVASTTSQNQNYTQNLDFSTTSTNLSTDNSSNISEYIESGKTLDTKTDQSLETTENLTDENKQNITQNLSEISINETNENLIPDSGETVELEPITIENQSTVFSSNIVNS